MRRGEARGFTLIEMIVVLVILGLALGIATLMGRPQHAAIDMQEASSLVSATLRAARGRAIAENRVVAVRIVPGGAAVEAEGDRAVVLPPAVRASGTGPIVFRPDGSSSGGVVALSGAERRIAIEVNWLTGRVSGRVSGRVQ